VPETPDGRAVLVVGGGGGLGLAISNELAERGYRVYVTVRRPAEYGPVRARLADAGVLSWTPPAPAAPVVAEVVGDAGHLYGLVYCPGPLGRRQSVAATTAEEWEALRVPNLDGAWAFVRAALPHLRACRGRIVALAAVGAAQAAGWSGHGAYMAAKAGLVALMRSLAREEEPQGVTVNLVAPSRIRGAAKTAMQSGTGGHGPVGGEVAAAVAFLLDPRQAHVTGQVLELSFGLGVGLRPGNTTLPWPERMEPIGKAVQPAPWKARGITGVIVDREIVDGTVWYRVDGPPGTVWVPHTGIVSVPGELS
jgi:NAD(P)-dependent dehydrogenase (short-subunit alcohol dehydrogenase family)